MARDGMTVLAYVDGLERGVEQVRHSPSGRQHGARGEAVVDRCDHFPHSSSSSQAPSWRTNRTFAAVTAGAPATETETGGSDSISTAERSIRTPTRLPRKRT